MILAIEGVDGVGKNTQAKILAKELNAEVISFPDYHNTFTGKYISQYLNNDWEFISKTQKEATESFIFQCLQIVNRLEVLNKINELISKKKNIVFDRYYASAIVYGTVTGVNKEWLQEIHKFLPEPDFWIFLDAPEEESIKRRPERRDRYEKEKGFLTKVRKEYWDLFTSGFLTKNHSQATIVSGIGTKEEITKRILHTLEM